MNKQSRVIAEVEDFIKRVHDGDLVISPKAAQMVMILPTGKKRLLGLTSKRKRNLADLLGWAMAAYQFRKDVDSLPSQLQIAYEFLDMIERARAYGVIIEQNLTNKLKGCVEQNKRLKDNQQKLGTQISKLKKENKELHKALGRFGDRSEVIEE